MRVLVTGAGGFVGRALTARLLAAALAAGTGGEGLELVLVDQQPATCPATLGSRFPRVISAIEPD